MGISLLHTTQSSKPQSSDSSLISRNAWNEEHSLIQSAAGFLGRTSAGAVGLLTTLEAQTLLDSPIVVLPTLALAQAYAPAVAPTGIYLAGNIAAGDLGAGLYVKVNSEPAHEGKFSITLVNTSTVWYELDEPVVRPEHFGGFADNTSDASAAINKALGVLSVRGGGRVSCLGVGTYKLTNQGASGVAAGGGQTHRYSILINSSSVELEIGPSSILKLPNSTQTDASGPIDFIVIATGLSSIRIFGGGLINGNSTNQAGWTGASQPTNYNSAYAQDINGCGITNGSPGNLTDITIENLRFSNTFSNPVNIYGGESARNTRVNLRNLYGSNHGEGFQLVWCDDSHCDDVVHEDLTSIDKSSTGGDGFEMAMCRRSTAKNITVRATNTHLNNSSAIDVGGCTDLRISGVLIDGWRNGFGVSTGPTGITDNILIDDVEAINIYGDVILDPPIHGRCVYSNVRTRNCAAYLMQVIGDLGASDLPPVEMYNVMGDAVGSLLVTGNRKIIWRGGGLQNAVTTPYGVYFQRSATGSTGNFTVTIASPAVFTKASHGLTAGTRIQLTTSGTLPTGLALATTYWVLSAGLTGSTFRVSALEPGGDAVNTSGSQSGTHTLTVPNDASPHIEFSDLLFDGNSYDLNWNNNSQGPITTIGSMNNVTCRSLASGTGYPVNASSDDIFTGLQVEGFDPTSVATNALNPGDNIFVGTLIRSGTDMATIYSPHKDRKLTIIATGSFVVKDASQSGGDNITLTGGSNYSMVSGESLSLQYNASLAKWVEIGRLGSSPIVEGSTKIISGTDKQVQFNDAGVIQGSTGLAYTKGNGGTTSILTLGGKLNIYNLFTDVSNYEEGFLAWSGDALWLGTQHLGTGTYRDIVLAPDNDLVIRLAGASRWLFDGDTAAFLAVSDNAYNIGALQASRPASVYVGTRVFTPAITSYNFYTDASNYEQVTFSWASDVFIIATSHLGTGTYRDISIAPDNSFNVKLSGANRWTFDGNTAALFASVDNAYDIGAVAANRPANIYVGTLVATPALRINATPSAIGTGVKTISNAADGSTNFGHYITINMNGTAYYIPASATAPT